jgi:hypothetical protein
VTLRDTGVVAGVELPEALFDADYPGHYFRRLKAVSVTVSTVKPSQDGVQCELTLTRSAIRTTGLVSEAGYKADPTPYTDAEERFVVSPKAVKALSTSSGDDDAGMFQLDLRDEKLLPFEGAGAVSTWTIEVPRDTNRFPLHKVSDVMLHLRYTSRDGGAALRAVALATGETGNRLKRRVRVFSARGDFQVQWAKFVQGSVDQSENTLELPIAARHFWSFFGEDPVNIVSIEVSATFAAKHNPPPPPVEGDSGLLKFTLTYGAPPMGASLSELEYRKGEPSTLVTPAAPVAVLPEDHADFERWVLVVPVSTYPSDIRVLEDDPQPDPGLLKPDALEDIWLHVTYEARS